VTPAELSRCVFVSELRQNLLVLARLDLGSFKSAQQLIKV
jgi:hypothetical protein